MSDLVFDSLSEVPEEFQGGFTHHDGKFIPKAQADLLAEIEAVKAAKKQGFEQFHNTKAQLESTSAELAEYRGAESNRAEKIRQEAEDQLRKDGKFDELLKAAEDGRAKDAEDHQLKFGEALTEYESKLKSEVEEKSQLQAKYEDLRSAGMTKDRNLIANSLASAYAPKNMAAGVAQLLASNRTKEFDGEIKFTDAHGNPMDTTDTDAVMESLAKDPVFSAFAAAPDSSGGQGRGGSNEPQSKNTLTRSQLKALPPEKRMEAIKAGTKITD